MTEPTLPATFLAGYPFGLDQYQIDACRVLDQGRGVLVAAPTGAGKTVVGEYAVYKALSDGEKCFYTTPIKALSNQKFHDLVQRYGPDAVGLLTGDTSVNSEAPIVVMTTEVLRNMMYARSRTLTGLGYVVMDEVHYLADRFRGPVWEEIIIGLPHSVRLVGLSATVSNAEEFGDWLDEVRGGVDVVLSERRPVPLFQHVMVGRRLVDLFDGEAPKVNPELVKLAKSESREVRDDARRPRGHSGRGKKTVAYGSGRYGGASANRGGERRRRLTPTRGAMARALEQATLLPAIVFVFSRQGCEGAVRQLTRDEIRLTTHDEAHRLRAIAERHLGDLARSDLAALGYDEFLDALTRGVAAHHAGLLPAFKAVVEGGFTAGLIKIVFATETLALGINMPARTVVLEKLVKYNGESHADITPGEYTQLTGRAGRRGIDVEGHAVVLWQAGMDPRAVAGLASRRTYPLRSAFTPTYNMAVNMVRTVGRDHARELLGKSFAQFQIDRSIVAQNVGQPTAPNARSRRRAESRSNSIAVKFDRVCGVLASLGYLDEDGEQVTEAGERLARIYGEMDLVTAECVRAGVLDGLEAPQLAAVLSSLVYESRLRDRRPTRLPDAATQAAVGELRRVWREVSLLERDFRLDAGREPDYGFCRAAYDWCRGRELGPILEATELPAGDFVRWVRQVIDLAGQLANALPAGDTRSRLRQVVAAMRRGVVDFDADE